MSALTSVLPGWAHAPTLDVVARTHRGPGVSRGRRVARRVRRIRLNAREWEAECASGREPCGDIPDTQAFVTFMSPDGTFSLKVPEGWSRAQTGSSTLFIDKFNSVRVETTTMPSPPTVASATAVEVPAIAAATPGFKLGTVSTVRRSAGDAVLVTYRADSTTDAVTGRSVRLEVERYEFAKNGQQAALTLSAPVGADNVDPWKTITNSFGWAA